MATENFPFHITTVTSGIEQDVDPEISGAPQGAQFPGVAPASNGLYLDGHNTRPISTTGGTGSNEKIQGEEILYPNNKGLTGYSCEGSTTVNNYLVEFWAKAASPGIVVVNGVIVLNSIKFDLQPNNPLQIDKNESPINQEVFFTDRRVPPYILNVQDMVDQQIAGSQTYFSAFDPLLYQVNLQSPLDRPKFIELINVGKGLPVGQYEYFMRYTSEEGDVTQWSQGSGFIPVMEGLSTDSRCYPWSKTYGGPPAPSSATAFAPRIRFRVTNLYNYDFIEIKRVPYNQGAGIQFVPQGTVVYRTAITKQEVSVREFVDPQDQNETILLSEANETQQLAEVESCSSLRYFDRRLVLMNIKLASKDSSLTFLKINNKEAFPVIDWLGKGSHKDPWNHVNRKSYMGGERFGFGVVGFDGVGTSGFVTKTPDFKNYQYPNRRDTVAAETSNYSFNGPSQPAIDTDINVTRTHEVFDLQDAAAKSDVCSFKNIVRKGGLVGLTGTKTTSVVTEDCLEDPGEIENHGASVSGGIVSVAYEPYTPVRQNDTDVTGHEYVTNTKVYTDADTAVCSSPDDKEHDYRPPAMSPDYFSHGMMFAGIDNFPKWMKAFSIVRTPAANRVICQGIGFYELVKAKYLTVGSTTLAGKETKKLSFYSPDLEHGIVASDTLNDIIDNPQNYQIQCVSPLGFFSEVYGFENNVVSCNRDRIVDMITYVRMTRDLNSTPINPGEDPNMGYNPGDGYSYPGYDKFRNFGAMSSAFVGQPGQGNRLFNLTAVRRKTEGRGQFVELELDSDLYANPLTGGATERQFDDNGLKHWTEPIYIINIVRTGAIIPDTDVQKYKSTDHYQKLESVIGKGNGQINQTYQLVDERWEDCIPAPKSTYFGANVNRYLYIKKADGTYNKWINTTYLAPALTATIIAAILSTGTYGADIKGVYSHINLGGLDREFSILFYHPTIIPQVDELIIVKYDNAAPIRVYGGDTYIAETIFAPIDKVADANADAAETQFAFGVGFPYFKWKMNPRQYVIKKSGAAVNVIQDNEHPKLGYIRQLCVMFCCESRTGIHYAYNSEYPNQFFPLMNYVIRPNRWDDTKNLIDNGIFAQYADDYGDNEYSQWKYGGFRFLQQINPDYSCEPPIKFFSRPEFGFKEKTNFPTGIMWSLSRAVNIQNSPGLRTFPANNFFQLSDNGGEIKYAYDEGTDKGFNLYAITDSSIFMLITKKSILSDLNSSQLGLIAVDSFIRQEYWLNDEVGMNDEAWRSAVSNYVPPSGNESEVRDKCLFFCNNVSVFRFQNNVVVDIGRRGYYNKVYNQGIKNIGDGFSTKITSAYNKLYHEYWLTLGDTTYVWGQKNGRWFGTNDFNFDKITSQDNTVFGSRNLETYELNKGYIINGQPITQKLMGASAPEKEWDKEFIAIRVNSNDKPTSVEFYKELNGILQHKLSQGDQGSLYMKNYRGYEGQIGRILASVDANRPRLQGRVLIWQITHTGESAFKIVNVGTQYKRLKIK